VLDAADAMSQYFETDVTPRIGYSNPKFDEIIARIRQEFDPVKRCDLQNEAAAMLVNDAPVIQLWTHKMTSGVRKSVTFPANAGGEIWLTKVRM